MPITHSEGHINITDSAGVRPRILEEPLMWSLEERDRVNASEGKRKLEEIAALLI